MTSNLSVLLKKYSIPALFFVLGIMMLVIGVSKNQGSMFMMAAVLMFIAGILSIGYSSGKFKSGVVYILGIGAGIAAAVTLYFSYLSVEETATYNTNYVTCKSLAKQNLEDIRYIQKAYADLNGKFADNWEDLVGYVKNGTVPFIDAEGTVPSRILTQDENKFLYSDNRPTDNNMTEEEAYRLSKWQAGPNWGKDFKNFKRDTVQVSLSKTKFQSKAYTASRKKSGFHKFSADSLPYIPFTGARTKWKLETKDSVQVGESKLPAIRVSGMIPFANIKGKNDDKEEMFFGSLSTNDTSGSWESE